jgi:hypothetical protein
MVRKLHARLEVTNSNPRTRARVYFVWKIAWLVACDLRVCEGLPGVFNFFDFFDIVVPTPLVPAGIESAWGPSGGFLKKFLTFFDAGVLAPLVPVGITNRD